MHPNKGEVLKYRTLLENRSMLVKKARPIHVECVVRDYLSGSRAAPGISNQGKRKISSGAEDDYSGCHLTFIHFHQTLMKKPFFRDGV